MDGMIDSWMPEIARPDDDDDGDDDGDDDDMKWIWIWIRGKLTLFFSTSSSIRHRLPRTATSPPLG